MKKSTFILLAVVLLVVLILSYSINGFGYLLTQRSRGPAATVPSQYALIAWNDLGMHCIDQDFSVFAILPPYNNLHAQLIDRLTGRKVTADVVLTYEAVPDVHGSINSTSAGKTNFWEWVLALFGVSLPVDEGLTGNPAPTLTPAPLRYDPEQGYWKAEGLPIVPYDDAGRTNYYPMVKVTARDRQGRILATTRNVLPVSDELACSHCHLSGTGDPAAQPSPNWVYDTNPRKDWKRNILLLHDNRNQGNPIYAEALAGKGYKPSGLLATADGGQPILCAKCHASNALGTPGTTGVKALTAAMHTWHGLRAMDDNTGMPLDQTMDRTGCYYCHPGSTTQCLRGVMGSAKNADGSSKLECQSCHGSMLKVGAVERAGWVDLPKCQYCHYPNAEGRYVQDTSAFDGQGNFKQTAGIFSTGEKLYKQAATHGNLQCESCHGATHAEYATSEANDNVQSLRLQGYAGTVAECSVCHGQALPVSDDGGPHGLHTLGQIWVFSHGRAARTGPEACTTCHGKDRLGTRLSRTFTARTFFATGRDKVEYLSGQMVACSDCHHRRPGTLFSKFLRGR